MTSVPFEISQMTSCQTNHFFKWPLSPLQKVVCMNCDKCWRGQKKRTKQIYLYDLYPDKLRDTVERKTSINKRTGRTSHECRQQ